MALEHLGAVLDVGEVALPADPPEDPRTQSVPAQDVKDARHPTAVECRVQLADALGGPLGGQIGGQLGEGVQHSNDFRLDFKRFYGVVWAGDWDFEILYLCI